MIIRLGQQVGNFFNSFYRFKIFLSVVKFICQLFFLITLYQKVKDILFKLTLTRPLSDIFRKCLSGLKFVCQLIVTITLHRIVQVFIIKCSFDRLLLLINYKIKKLLVLIQY